MNLDLKTRFKYILLAIFSVFLMISCVLPGVGNFVATPIPTETGTKTSEIGVLPTLLPTLTSDCKIRKESNSVGIVVASENGGLNIRTSPIEDGGIVLATMPNNSEFEIFSVANGWSEIRYLNGLEYICGYVNNSYIKIKNPNLE